MLFPNINKMNNLLHFQSLLKKKKKLDNYEIEFNSLLTGMKNKGISPEDIKQLNALSFHFINFGVKLLNIGIQFNNNNLINNHSIKESINELIANLKEISFSIPDKKITETNSVNSKIESEYQNIKEYGIKFETSNKEIEKLLYFDSNLTVDDVIKQFLIEIGRRDLFDNEDKEIVFYYEKDIINNSEIKPMKISKIFKDDENPLILLFLEQN